MSTAAVLLAVVLARIGYLLGRRHTTRAAEARAYVAGFNAGVEADPREWMDLEPEGPDEFVVAQRAAAPNQ